MIRIGVIGAGYWGPLHIRAFSRPPDATVTMAADVSRERLLRVQRAFPEVQTTEDAEQLVAGPVDAVVVSTPATTHAAIAGLALAQGKHVLVEKPLTTTSAEAAALIDRAALQGLTLMAGHTIMYHAAVRALRDLVQGGGLGRPLYVDAKRVNLGLHRKDVDVVWDLAPHDIAILRYVLGEDPIEARVHGASFHVTEVAEVAYVELRYPSGVLANLHVSWLDPVKVRRMTVAGDRRMAVWDDLEPVEKLRVYDRGMERRPYFDDFGQWQVAYRHGGSHAVPLVFEEPLRLQAAEFCRAIRTGDPPLTDGNDGLAVVRTLEAATATMRLGSTATVREGR
ncbi:MAG: Gfo/Idh/MocA family protein [Dehalococcoidia bacterium]